MPWYFWVIAGYLYCQIMFLFGKWTQKQWEKEISEGIIPSLLFPLTARKGKVGCNSGDYPVEEGPYPYLMPIAFPFKLFWAGVVWLVIGISSLPSFKKIMESLFAPSLAIKRHLDARAEKRAQELAKPPEQATPELPPTPADLPVVSNDPTKLLEAIAKHEHAIFELKEQLAEAPKLPNAYRG
ncbi:MAG TPA: hypothetical protein VFQ60_03860 [Patescibacteria group bacterium]|nr:hypothetical protein [Patescibacteria group bacterium]